MRFAHGLFIVFALATLKPDLAAATDYEYCISSDRRPGHVLVRSGPADFGKEWYRVKAAQAFCQATGASGCGATDYSAEKCGTLPAETLTYVSANGDQIKALFSGNPALMGQTAVEIVVGVPVKLGTEAVKGVAQGANKVCRWFAPHC